MCHHNTPVVLLIEVTAVEVADVASVVIVIVVTLVTAVAGTLRSDKKPRKVAHQYICMQQLYSFLQEFHQKLTL